MAREYININPFLDEMDKLVLECKEKNIKKYEHLNYILNNIRNRGSETYKHYISMITDEEIKEMYKFKYK